MNLKMLKGSLNFIKGYKKISIVVIILLIYLLFFLLKIFQPKVEYIDYSNQELVLNKDTKIINIFRSSHEVCSYWTTKIIKNWKEEILIDFPHTKELYIKWCAVDIIYINKNTLEFPICYAWWAWSWECTLVFMQYNVDTKKWLYKWVEDYYVWEGEYSLYIKILKPFFIIMSLFNYEDEKWEVDYSYLKWLFYWKSVMEVLQEKHFDEFFFKFINYFNDNYWIDNFDELNDLYKNNISLLGEEEKFKIVNTIYYYVDRDIDYWMAFQAFDKEIISYFDKNLTKIDKKYLAKLKYAQDIHKFDYNYWTKYNKNILFDDEVKKIFEKVLKQEEDEKKNRKVWY